MGRYQWAGGVFGSPDQAAQARQAYANESQINESARQFDKQRDDRNQFRDLLLEYLGIGTRSKPGDWNSGYELGAGGGVGGFGGPSAGLYASSHDRLVNSLNQNMADVEAFGDSHRQRITRDFDASRESAAANLESRGLGSSSLAPTTQAAVDEAYQQTLLGLEDALLGQKIGVRERGEGAIAGATEGEANRRTSTFNNLINMI